MKIATYNLRCGGKANQRVHWTQLFEVANPDIFLVQETCSPEQYVTSRFWEAHQQQVQWAKVGTNAWGSAVFVRSGTVNRIPVPNFEGCVVGVEVEGFAWSANQRRKLSSAFMRQYRINLRSIEYLIGLAVCLMTVI